MTTANGRHSRDDVVAAALAILDEVGLPDLTMRRLAAALDVQPSALYWHVPNKQTLLAAVSDRIVARAAAPAGDVVDPEWRQAVTRQARDLRDALLAFRDGAEVVASSLALGLGGDAARAGLRLAIASGDFDERTAAVAADALLHFVLGHVSHEQQRLQADALGVVAPAHVADIRQLDAPLSESESFEFGIRLLVSGLERERTR